jgi:hypothetical protein
LLLVHVRCNIIWIDPNHKKSLYGLKTSAARFHEHLADSLLRLGCKKHKRDPDLWLIDKTSHYEYLARFVDDILIWSKDVMAVIKPRLFKQGGGFYL